MKKILMLAVFLLLTFLASCTSNSPSDSGGVSPSSKIDGAYATVNGEDISNTELEYAIVYAIQNDSMYKIIDFTQTIDGLSMSEHYKKLALDAVIGTKAILENAVRLGCELSEEEHANIDSMFEQEIKDAGGDAEFDRILENDHCNRELFKLYNYILPNQSIKMETFLFGDGGQEKPTFEEIKAYYDEKYINTAYIYLSATDDDYVRLVGEELETQRKVAQALRKQAFEGADFFQLMSTHGQDMMMTMSPEGIPIPRDYYGEAFETALVALKENEISEVVETEDGFYIIKRLPPNDEFLTSQIEEITYEFTSLLFSERVTEWSKPMVVATSEAWEKLDAEDFYGVG